MTAPQDKITAGKSVRIHFTVTAEDGQVLESTKGKPPLYYVQGSSRILAALQQKLEGRTEGEVLEFTLQPEDAYGPFRPEAVEEISRTEMPADRELQAGMTLQETRPDGSLKVGRILEVRQDTVLMNFNHPMAGKVLHYKVEVTGVMDKASAPGLMPMMREFPRQKPRPEDQ